MPSPVEELLAECESAIQSRNFEDAITGCRTVLTMAPDNLRAKELLEEAQSKLEAELFVRENMRKAQEAFQNRDYQKCINECQKIQLLDPDNPAVSELLSRAQEKLEAEPFIQNFITSGQSLFDSGLYGEAVAQWEKVRSIDPMFPGLDELIRSAKTRSGAPVDAAPAAIFQLDTASTGPELNLDSGLGFTPEEEASGGFGFDSDKERIQKLLREGDELAGSGDHQKAIEVWSEIFMLDVSNEDALQRIEASRNVLAALSPTMESEQGAEEEGAGSLESLMQKGTQAEAAGQYREAAQYLSQALAIDADNADLADRIKNLNLLAKKTEQGKAVLGNAKAFFAEGKVESARHALSKILEADPENEEALELMREIKNSGAAGAPEMRAPVASKAPPARSFPVIPAAVVVGVILVGGGLFAYFGMGKKDGAARTNRPM